MTPPDLNVYLEADRPADAAPRGRLAPYRDTLLTQRAKKIGYERIAAALAKDGVRVSPTWVGSFCRMNFASGEIARRQRELAARTNGTPSSPATAPTAVRPTPASPVATVPGRRGPKIARDDY